MDLVPSTGPFTFNYVAYDQNEDLFVAGMVYDVTTGTPNLLVISGMINVSNGLYSGNFVGTPGKTYLVIAAAFTDDTYTTPAPFRSASCNCYQVVGTEVLFYAFAYGAFDMNAALDIESLVYEVTSGSPVLEATQNPVYVALGVYFSSYTGVLGEIYEIVSTVYTDDTYDTVNPNYSPSGENFNTASLNMYTPVYIQEAILVGQQTYAVLVESQ